MRFTVVCSPAVEAQLAQLWLRAIDQGALARSADEIDDILRGLADQVGQQFGDEYILVHRSLIVRYRISPADCLVEILSYELNLS